MPLLVLGRRDVEALLPVADCIPVVEEALAELARGAALQPLRSVLRLPGGRGLLALMPAQAGSPGVAAVKVLTVFPGNRAAGRESHQGAVLLFDGEHGDPLALVDAGAVTAIRTAAVSGLATHLLARPDAGDLAILGSGTQARTHLEAMRAVRALRRVRVWSRDPRHAARFAARESAAGPPAVEAVAEAGDAVAGADLVCTVTAASQPVLRGEWLAPGVHVNAVGACTPTTRELDAAAVRRARLFVDRRESALNEAGDILLARAEGAIGDDHVLGELGDLVLGRVAGRLAPDDVTLFESLGIAVEDLAAASHLHRRALELGRGTLVELG